MELAFYQPLGYSTTAEPSQLLALDYEQMERGIVRLYNVHLDSGRTSSVEFAYMPTHVASASRGMRGVLSQWLNTAFVGAGGRFYLFDVEEHALLCQRTIAPDEGPRFMMSRRRKRGASGEEGNGIGDAGRWRFWNRGEGGWAGGGREGSAAKDKGNGATSGDFPPWARRSTQESQLKISTSVQAVAWVGGDTTLEP